MPGLISDQLISNLRNVAYKQLVTPMTVRRQTAVAGPYGTDLQWTVVATSTCWFVPSYQAKVTPQIGFIGRVENCEIRMRWGENVMPGDRVTIEGAEYLVQDTNAGATISLYLKAYGEMVS